jgi:hypothetical protein
MQRKIAILFLTLFMLATNEIGAQFLKLPILVSHYIEHNSKHNMSVLEYLQHHYGGHDPDDDWATDMKLPFMTHAATLNFVCVINEGWEPSFPNNMATYIVKDKQRLIDMSHLPAPYTNHIWQPPKFS